MNKITDEHLRRTAYVYVRQSTMAQVQHNLESQRRQYGLSNRAKELGWAQVIVIDEDLGRSGSGDYRRQGFERLIGEVCKNSVGAIFAIEASRLARNGQEWHRLLEICGIFNTLIVDHDGIYDPKHPNDRLLLGMKGTVSEMELSTFRQRSREAIREKARRGEYYSILPVGYILNADGGLVKDPNRRVQEAISLLFKKFEELGSGRQVGIWFYKNQAELPRQLKEKGRPVEFRVPTPTAVMQILHNPTYAGAYVYGRTKQRIKFENEVKRKVTTPRALEDWEVLIKDHHEGYITWQQYERNRKLITENTNMKGPTVRGAAREGSALLAGMLRCGHCGAKMSVAHYQGTAKPSGYYACVGPYKKNRMRSCCGFGGHLVEQAVSSAVLEAISPLGIDAAQRAETDVGRKAGELQRQQQLQLEQARYEAQRCQRQYNAVEPENRLVAATLERRWNQSLEKVTELEQKLQGSLAPAPSLTEEQRQKLFALAEDLPTAWNHSSASHSLRKRIIRCVLKEIVAFVNDGKVKLILHWEGGTHTAIEVRRFKCGENRWRVDADAVELIRELAKQLSDRNIAALLNRIGKMTPTGLTWSGTRIANFRGVHDIPSYSEDERKKRGNMTVQEVAEYFSVSNMTVLRAISRKLLPAAQACRGAPWTILRNDLQKLKRDEIMPGSPHGRPQTADPRQVSICFS